MIIAIDGPAASGKSTVAKEVAKRLGYKYIDTGAMYRAVTWKALKEKLDITNEDALVALARGSNIEISDLKNTHYTVTIDGEDVTEAIRSPKVSAAVSTVSKVPGVRNALVKKQRSYADYYPNMVVEGRDIGTVVFPDADIKIFITASPMERARRRYRELKEKGHKIDLSTVERDIITRDKIDSTRPVGPLTKAPDAHLIDTTNKTIGQVVQQIIDLIKKQLVSG
ncbi:MAG: (d)CMP kinase [Actinomycetota bacterium]|nr:(d)CMP kinase [Actinomycetota bacterium]